MLGQRFHGGKDTETGSLIATGLVLARSEVIEFHRRRGLALVRLQEGGGSIRDREPTFVHVADAPPAPSDAIAVTGAGSGAT